MLAEETGKAGNAHIIDGAEQRSLMETAATPQQRNREMAALFFGTAKK